MTSRVVDIHRTRLNQILAEAEGLAGAATRVANQAKEVIERGGQLRCEPQFAFMVGSLSRLLKDIGVVEQLQADGVSARKKSI